MSWLREAQTYFLYPTYGSRMAWQTGTPPHGNPMGSQNNTYFGCKISIILGECQINKGKKRKRRENCSHRNTEIILLTGRLRREIRQNLIQNYTNNMAHWENLFYNSHRNHRNHRNLILKVIGAKIILCENSAISASLREDSHAAWPFCDLTIVFLHRDSAKLMQASFCTRCSVGSVISVWDLIISVWDK